MGWKCNQCGETSDSDSLDFAIMHETANPGHEVEPDTNTVLRWGRAFGQL